VHGEGPAQSAGPVRESRCAIRYDFLSDFLVAFLRVTRVAAFAELFVAFAAVGFFGETFFATRFTSPHRSSSERHRYPIARS
jgi:hypothetical protein